MPIKESIVAEKEILKNFLVFQLFFGLVKQVSKTPRVQFLSKLVIFHLKCGVKWLLNVYKWRFSVDHLELKIIKVCEIKSIERADFNGLI